MEKLGRLNSSEMGLVPYDAPEKTVSAVLTKQDEIIAKLNLILDAIETATDAASLFAALDVAEVKSQLSEVNLYL